MTVGYSRTCKNPGELFLQGFNACTAVISNHIHDTALNAKLLQHLNKCRLQIEEENRIRFKPDARRECRKQLPFREEKIEPKIITQVPPVEPIYMQSNNNSDFIVNETPYEIDSCMPRTQEKLKITVWRPW